MLSQRLFLHMPGQPHSPTSSSYGISFEKMSNLNDYSEKLRIPFDLYIDSLGKFTGQHKFDTYPTIIGVNEKRKIAFIEFANNPKKTAKDYLKLFRTSR